PVLRVVVLVAGLVVAVALVALTDAVRRAWAVVLAAAALTSSIAAPLAYSLSTASTAENGALVAAGPATATGRGGPAGGAGTTSTKLTALIAASGNYRWAAATNSSMTAAPLELATGKAVMALGGFNGSDRAITLEAFKKLVA